MGKSSTSFKKGHKPVSPGRKPLPKETMEARNLSYNEMCTTVIEVRHLTPNDLKKIDMNNVSLGKRAIINAYAKLDYRGIKDYEDRLWGKAKETLDLGLNLDELDEHQLNKLNEIRKRVLDNG